MSSLVNVVVLLVLAAAVALIGRWGQRNATRLVAPTLSEHHRRRKIGALRRGGVACYVAGGAFVFLAVLSVL